MGLDMYLKKKVYKYRRDDGTLSNNHDDMKWDEYGCSNGVLIETDIAYWRKANMIHRWFVNNVQEGTDDCKEYEVSIDQLKELRDLCFKIVSTLDGEEIRVPKKYVDKFEKLYGNKKEYTQRIKFSMEDFKDLNLTGYHVLSKRQVEKIDGILPTQDGFFFGNTEYNGMYLDDIIDTIRKLDHVIEDSKTNDGVYGNEYLYHASW